MATYEENKAALATLISDIEVIEAQAESDIAAKQEDIDTLAVTILAQEEACGHTSWTKVDGEWAIECDACGKKVEFVDPALLWPWAT